MHGIHSERYRHGQKDWGCNNNQGRHVYAKGFGWAAELNLEDCYRKLFEHQRGAGYPKERAAIMAKNRGILADLKAASCRDMLSVVKTVDQDLLRAAIAGERFAELFYANAKDQAISDYLRSLT